MSTEGKRLLELIEVQLVAQVRAREEKIQDAQDAYDNLKEDCIVNKKVKIFQGSNQRTQENTSAGRGSNKRNRKEKITKKDTHERRYEAILLLDDFQKKYKDLGDQKMEIEELS